MDKTEREHTEKLLETVRRRLQVLERQAAGFGELHVPAYIQTEIDTARDQIQQYDQQLKSGGGSTPSASPTPQRSDGSVSIHGGTFYGPITGANSGSVATRYGDLSQPPPQNDEEAHQ